MRLARWPGELTAGTGRDLFDPGGEAAVGSAHSLRVGAHLHITVVVAQPTGNQPLLPGQRYSYNVRLRPDVAIGGVDSHDLRTERFLVEDPAGGQPPLGYQPGMLPSVETCPLTLDELVLVRGSCNRIGGPRRAEPDVRHRQADPRQPGRGARPRGTSPAVAHRRPGLLRRDRRGRCRRG